MEVCRRARYETNDTSANSRTVLIDRAISAIGIKDDHHNHDDDDDSRSVLVNSILHYTRFVLLIHVISSWEVSGAGDRGREAVQLLARCRRSRWLQVIDRYSTPNTNDT